MKTLEDLEAQSQRILARLEQYQTWTLFVIHYRLIKLIEELK